MYVFHITFWFFSITFFTSVHVLDFLLNISIKNRCWDLRPGEEFSLNVEGDPGAKVGLVVVDKAATCWVKRAISGRPRWLIEILLHFYILLLEPFLHPSSISLYSRSAPPDHHRSSTKFHSGCETLWLVGLSRSRTHCQILWRIYDGLGVLQQGWNRADLSLWRTYESSHVQVCPGRKVASALTMFPNSEDWFFQQDNAPCHTARSIKVWMEDLQIKTLSWPAQSPDLNPIKNLWNVLKRKMDGHKPLNKAELLEFLHQWWHKVTQHQCERLVERMPRRMKAVIENRPYSTKNVNY